MKALNVFPLLCLMGALAGCSDDGGAGSSGTSTGGAGTGGSSVGGGGGGSGGGETGGSASGGAGQTPEEAADYAVNNRQCYLSLPPPDFLQPAGFGCSGSATLSTVSMMNGVTGAPGLRFRIELNSPPALGVLDVSAINVSTFDGMQILEWNADVSTCTLTARAIVHNDFDGFDYVHIDVSCSAPAAPAAGNTMAPYDLSNVVLVTLFDPTP